jgi:hypothetical protein
MTLVHCLLPPLSTAILRSGSGQQAGWVLEPATGTEPIFMQGCLVRDFNNPYFHPSRQ